MLPAIIRLISVVWATFALIQAAEAQTFRLDSSPDVVMTNASSRDGLNLSGGWTWSVDPYRDGLQGFHGTAAGKGHQRFDPVDVDEATRKNPGDLYEYDMRRADKATLPGSWVSHTPELRYYQGLMWYARDFHYSPKPGKRYFLRIEAANYTARVYLNGTFAGAHEGGFTPFTIDVTGLVLEGENSITVGVDSVRTDQSVPPPVTDWETYGGITRDIQLIEVPGTFIDEAWVRLTRDGNIAASVRINGNACAGQAVEIAVSELELTMRGTSDESGQVELRTTAPHKLAKWSPENPKLYDVVVSTAVDRLHERIGFRTIEVKDEDILLNGKSIFLRGISMHEEELGTSPARAMSESSARALLSEIKYGLHGNFVRLAHYPHSESTLRLADEMGLLVWSEVPVYWLIDWDSGETLDTARSMIAENIHRDRNRAPIILWSVANETPVSDARNRFLQTLISDVRALDDTRLITAALLTRQTEENGQTIAHIDDPLTDFLDVLAVNTYNGWYGDMPLDAVHDIKWPDDHGKPLIFSEFGAAALAGFHDPELIRKFSEEYQAEYYRQTLDMSSNITFLRGMSPWILKDFRSPRRQHPIYQRGWNRKGLLSETGRRKEAFNVLAAHYKMLEASGIAHRATTD